MARSKKLTIEEIRNLDREMLTPLEASGVLKCSAYQINLQARSDAENGTKYLPFKCLIVGRRVKVPRNQLIKYIDGELTERT